MAKKKEISKDPIPQYVIDLVERKAEKIFDQALTLIDMPMVTEKEFIELAIPKEAHREALKTSAKLRPSLVPSTHIVQMGNVGRLTWNSNSNGKMLFPEKVTSVESDFVKEIAARLQPTADAALEECTRAMKIPLLVKALNRCCQNIREVKHLWHDFPNLITTKIKNDLYYFGSDSQIIKERNRYMKFCEMFEKAGRATNMPKTWPGYREDIESAQMSVAMYGLADKANNGDVPPGCVQVKIGQFGYANPSLNAMLLRIRGAGIDV